MSNADTVLEKITGKLRTNDRVKAVWLSGSRGRGTDDQYSDIDVWVAIDDAHIATVNADPLAFVEEMVPTILHVDAPSIAPLGGSFIGTWIPISDSFVQVDWYFSAIESAERHPDTRMVFGAVPERPRVTPMLLPTEEISRLANDNLILAMIMIGNLVKHSVRGNAWQTVEHARHADRCLVRADILLTSGVEPNFLQLKQSVLNDSIPLRSSEVQLLVHHLLDGVQQLSQRAGSTALVQPAIDAMRRTIRDWQASGHVPRDEYYASPPRRYMSAGVLITVTAGRVLLLETTYKQQYEIPGGVCEAGEAPRETAIREVREELGIDLQPGAILVMDHRSQAESKGDSIQFIYDGGVLEDLAEIRLDSSEIATLHLISTEELDAHTAPPLAFRVRAALKARDHQRLIELRDGKEIG